MIEIIKELSIEVTKPNIFQAIVAKQYDMNTRFLKVTLMDCGNRIDVPLTETTKVVINAERKDGQSKGFDGVINEDGTVTVPLHSWMLELDGTVICDISVMDVAEDDNKKLTTTSFTLLVEKAAYGGDDITSDPQYDVLVQLLESCAEANTVAEEALAKSNEANAKYEACVEATENANAATEELGTIKEELAEGGYITGIKESNNGNILGFWVGTQAEYDELPEPPKNSYVIIVDDAAQIDFPIKQGTVVKNIFDVDKKVAGHINWTYEQSQNGICKLWGYGPVTFHQHSPTGNAYISELFNMEFPFKVFGRVVVGIAGETTSITNMGSGLDSIYSNFRLLIHQEYTEEAYTNGIEIPINVLVFGRWK